MASRAHREAMAARARELLARGPMTREERVQFDLARAYEMHRAELRRHPDQVAPELPLANWRDCANGSDGQSQAPLKRVA